MIETPRLILRRWEDRDRPVFHGYCNDPRVMEHLGPLQARAETDAAIDRQNGFLDSHGYCFWAVERREDGALIGMCGLIKRDTLDDVDIGFAYLPAYRAQGYAREAAAATLAYGRDVHGLRRVVAIVSPANHASARLLERVGLRYEAAVRPAADRDPIDLFAIEFT